jgi:hypothetical protein
MTSTEDWNKDKEIESQRHELFHANAYIGELHSWIKSDSVYTLLRYGAKSPTIVDGMDDHYTDLYNLSEQLRFADHQENENRKDAFDQRLP